MSLPSFDRRRLAVASLACVLTVATGAGAARAAEVAPQISLAGGIVFVSFVAPSLDDGEGGVTCFVSGQAADGSFTCSVFQGASLSGRVVGVTNAFGVVVGHRVRMARQASSTVAESFDAALARTSSDAPYLWLAGSLERTTRTRECTLGRCLVVQRTTGPLPFTGEVFPLGG